MRWTETMCKISHISLKNIIFYIFQVFLMIVIMLTGNYNFFNFLFMGLCLSLADDSWLRSGQNKPGGEWRIDMSWTVNSEQQKQKWLISLFSSQLRIWWTKISLLKIMLYLIGLIPSSKYNEGRGVFVGAFSNLLKRDW